MATDTTTLKGKYTESLTFSTPNCIYADYGKFGKPSLPNYGTHCIPQPMHEELPSLTVPAGVNDLVNQVLFKSIWDKYWWCLSQDMIELVVGHLGGK